MSTRTPSKRLSLLGGALALALVSACSGSVTGGDDPSADSPQSDTSQASQQSQARVTSNVRTGAKGVDISRKIRLHVASGTLQEVQVTGPKGGIVQGRLSPDKTRWVSTTPLQAASRYRVTSTAVDADGLKKGYETGFRTRTLTLDEQTYASFVPVDGQTVGVGMPVIIRFDVPVTDKASIEKHLKVVSQPAQAGSFYWVSSQEVHWRPKSYWRPGTNVTVNADIAGVPAGNGIYGQSDRSIKFHVGDAMISKVDTNTDHMRVFRNGKLIRTIPITTGQQPKFTTRSGHQGHRGEVPPQADELRDDRHRPEQRGRLRPRRRRVRHAGDLLRRVRARGAVVGRRPGQLQRQPRLHRHEHRQRRLVLQPVQGRRRGAVHRHQQGHDAHQRVRRLEHVLRAVQAGSALS